ncbi:MAG: hypothetical protein KDI90_02425 [Alphaproteobacteria bacterium]|nr:hypothetical protein [Alphaproteobacteria bacterium]MCB9974420.1 hypothetical protein [Rhodospirillales bacterium]
MTDETNDQGAGGTAQDEDAELRQALETLKRIIERPKRAPFGTNDVWGWSTGKEHSLEPGTLPREQVVERIRGSYSPQVDGEPVAERSDSEISVLETISTALEKMGENPAYAHHDLKRIVKALEVIIADRIGPGDAPAEPSKMMVAPGTRTGRDISEQVAKSVLTPEEETLDYSYIVSDHPLIAELVKEHGLTSVWNELLRIRFQLPSVNQEIAAALSKAALTMDGTEFPDAAPHPHPKMYVDEKGEPVKYYEARATDLFPMRVYWDSVGVEEKAEVLERLKKDMDRSGRRNDYSSIRGLGDELDITADLQGDRTVWLELMRLRYNVWPRHEDVSGYIEDIAQRMPGLLDIPEGEEAPPVRLVADVKYEVDAIYRRGLELTLRNQEALKHRERLESGELGQYVKMKPWNTYVQVTPPDLGYDESLLKKWGLEGLVLPTASGQKEKTSKKAKGPEAIGSSGGGSSTREALESIESVTEGKLSAPAAGILADALRMAADQIEQQEGIAQAGVTVDEAEAKKAKPEDERIRKVFDDLRVKIVYTEGKSAAVRPMWGDKIVFFREIVTHADKEAQKMDKWRGRARAAGEDFVPRREYKDGKMSDVWKGVEGLSQMVFWDDLPKEGLAKDNPYYPFTEEYVKFICAMRDLANERFKSFQEATRISDGGGGMIARLKQSWKDSADGVKRIWTGRQMEVWREKMHKLVVRGQPLKGRPNWDLYNQMKEFDPPFNPPKLADPPW